MSRIVRSVGMLATATVIGGLAACVALQEIVQPPLFEAAPDRTSEVRLVGPAADRPLGGAQVRLWARVQNPNRVGLTLTRLAGNLLLEGDHAATIDLPLGLPLAAGGDTIFPLDLTISFADVPRLADQLRGALTGRTLEYSVRGTVGVDAGPFGEPTFGPTDWLRGNLQVVR